MPFLWSIPVFSSSSKNSCSVGCFVDEGKAVIEVDEDVAGPESLLKFLAGNDFAGTFEQECEDLEQAGISSVTVARSCHCEDSKGMSISPGRSLQAQRISKTTRCSSHLEKSRHRPYRDRARQNWDRAGVLWSQLFRTAAGPYRVRANRPPRPPL